MAKATDVRCAATALYFIPVKTRVPLKFGTEVLTSVTCARVSVTVVNEKGKKAVGWGETPLSVQWVWPSSISYEERHQSLQEFCKILAAAWAEFSYSGHALEIGYAFQTRVLPTLLKDYNQQRPKQAAMPWLAALVCCSPFDIALHDAYGILHGKPIYQLYRPPYMNRDLSAYLNRAAGTNVKFTDRYPANFLQAPAKTLPAWHLVGGLDPLYSHELAHKPTDGYPVLLDEWIERDGLKCLKVKLRGNKIEADYKRLVYVGQLAIAHGVDWLSTDFNCTVTDPLYVTSILDKLLVEHPRIYGMILYVEQPFPYELEQHRIDVHSISARKPLFMDESAHDWRMVKLGRELGWSGVALKTCKTQTGALLSLCWAKAHGMTLMVQDLTNPMLAMIPHVLLAAHAGTIMGVEVNAMQFYPAASIAEEEVHPGLYQRREGKLDISSIKGPGFGYRISEINRELPAPAVVYE